MISVGILTNIHKDTNLSATKRLVAALTEKNVNIFFDKAIAHTFGSNRIYRGANVDALFVLGGDGTILKAAQEAAEHRVHILGINLGRLGFLSEVESSHIDAAVDMYINGGYFIEERLMLRTELIRREKENVVFHSINDVYISKKTISRLIGIELEINSQIADRYSGDGVLVSTPTGSTGYSLSAGGPILSPALEAMVVTPVCPHTLHARSIVVKGDDEIMITPNLLQSGALVSSDGREAIELQQGDRLRIKKSELTSQFIRFKRKYFYSLLRSKFIQWNDSDKNR